MPRKIKDYGVAIEMYRSGFSLAEVAISRGVSRQAIWEAFKSRGVGLRSQIRSGRENTFFRNGNSSLRTRRKPAHRAIEKAVRDGLTSPGKCELCERRCLVHAHHDDYSLPFEIRWLCRKCHFAWHRTNSAEGTA